MTPPTLDTERLAVVLKEQARLGRVGQETSNREPSVDHLNDLADPGIEAVCKALGWDLSQANALARTVAECLAGEAQQPLAVIFSDPSFALTLAAMTYGYVARVMEEDR